MVHRGLLNTALVAGIAVIPSLSSATTIDTTGGWLGTGAAAFGEGDTATYGQTFKTPDAVNTVLDSSTFYLDDFLNTDFVDFAFYLSEWAGRNQGDRPHPLPERGHDLDLEQRRHGWDGAVHVQHRRRGADGGEPVCGVPERFELLRPHTGQRQHGPPGS